MATATKMAAMRLIATHDAGRRAFVIYHSSMIDERAKLLRHLHGAQ